MDLFKNLADDILYYEQENARLKKELVCNQILLLTGQLELAHNLGCKKVIADKVYNGYTYVLESLVGKPTTGKSIVLCNQSKNEHLLDSLNVSCKQGEYNLTFLTLLEFVDIDGTQENVDKNQKPFRYKHLQYEGGVFTFLTQQDSRDDITKRMLEKFSISLEMFSDMKNRLEVKREQNKLLENIGLGNTHSSNTNKTNKNKKI